MALYKIPHCFRDYDMIYNSPNFSQPNPHSYATAPSHCRTFLMKKGNYFLLEETDFSSNANRASLGRKEWKVRTEMLKGFELLYPCN